MEGSEPLTAEQLSELAGHLEVLHGELETLLGSGGEGAKPVQLDTAIGRVSRMDAMQQQQMAKANRESHQRRLRLVRAAMTRLEQGFYGDCQRCEEPIAYRRLKARPESPFCVRCQSSVERR